MQWRRHDRNGRSDEEKEWRIWSRQSLILSLSLQGQITDQWSGAWAHEEVHVCTSSQVLCEPVNQPADHTKLYLGLNSLDPFVAIDHDVRFLDENRQREQPEESTE